MPLRIAAKMVKIIVVYYGFSLIIHPGEQNLGASCGANGTTSDIGVYLGRLEQIEE